MEAKPSANEVAAVVAAAVDGDEAAFERLFQRHRRELQVHCYRMLGSLEDSEDLLQETFLRAWRARATFSSAGPRASFRAWLYRIATNACLDALQHKPRRVLASQLGPPADPLDVPEPRTADLPWLQPYPDHLLEGIAPSDEQPESVAIARETVEIAFLATLQLLPPRQRAVLIMRDVLGWSAKDTAALFETSVASANSALQRARATLQEHLPERRADWAPSTDPSWEERAVLQRFMDAFERADMDAIAELLHEDVRATMPPYPFWFHGREANVTAMAHGFDRESPHYMGEWRAVPTGSNMQPAAAFYIRPPGESEFRAFAIDVFRIEEGKVSEITSFVTEGFDAFPAFGLPPTL
ncbi:MAG TPA: sigma-70 family RNA polymerase sigma factor [Solirubrobacterales bacterium]|nr:sigma-70 family RNA polymerase sigma factor [Solirubrobacterales bacterium]